MNGELWKPPRTRRQPQPTVSSRFDDVGPVEPAAKPCTCIPCQCGLAIACVATEARIRADERARLRERIDLAVDDGQLLRLLHALAHDPRLRRAAGLLIHAVRQVVDDDTPTDHQHP